MRQQCHGRGGLAGAGTALTTARPTDRECSGGHGASRGSDTAADQPGRGPAPMGRPGGPGPPGYTRWVGGMREGAVQRCVMARARLSPRAAACCRPGGVGPPPPACQYPLCERGRPSPPTPRRRPVLIDRACRRALNRPMRVEHDVGVVRKRRDCLQCRWKGMLCAETQRRCSNDMNAETWVNWERIAAASRTGEL